MTTSRVLLRADDSQISCDSGAGRRSLAACRRQRALARLHEADRQCIQGRPADLQFWNGDVHARGPPFQCSMVLPAKCPPERISVMSGDNSSALPADAKLVHVTPAHQFPMGMPMSGERRVALLEWANQRNAVIVEDDYDSEFRFGGRPLETLQPADRNGRVIYVGSFAKSLLPALRLGFLIAPPSVTGALRVAAHVSPRFAQWPAQAALASFINDGLLGRHVRKTRRLYAERHERILTTLQRDFEHWLRPRASVSGLHVAATLRCGGVAAERRLTQNAARRGVAFEPLSRYCIRQKHSGVVLGYGGIATEDTSEGLRRLSLSFRGD